MKTDISNIEDIRKLVDVFYEKVQSDVTIGPIFDKVIENRWPEHLDKMYRFWQTVLLTEHTYKGSPFSHHAPLPIHKEHFDSWLKLFHETLDEFFEGKTADLAKKQSNVMAIMFQHKLEKYRSDPSNFIL
jgi:hemoglobin